MPRYCAFLRAINVGGRVVKMDRLRAIFEGLGLANVETFIASGNVIFDSRANPASLEKKIEAALKRELGYAVETFLRTGEELAAIAKYVPFKETGLALHCGFLYAPLDPAAATRVLDCRTPVDEFHSHGREIYWLCRVKFNESQVKPKAFEKALGTPVTFRSMTTVAKLAAKLNAGHKNICESHLAAIVSRRPAV
ncbi:MAG: DUF1697 domain-containing protein [Bryobacteraceae bacterium]|nr:DUF1697 domain-containing protein [Bryobacteraceae bacterium]